MTEEGPATKKLRFRNYLPESEDLVPHFIKSQTIEFANDPFSAELKRFQASEHSVIAPAVAHDLKTDIEPKLKVLTKRTQRAIVDLIRQRLASSSDPAPPPPSHDNEQQDDR